MANNTKEIRRRIKSIGNTKKITKAMEMVSATKMRRAVASVLAIRPYAHSAWSVLTNLARAFESKNKGLLEVREVKSVLILVITSNKGLCGSFNSQIIKKIRQELKDPSRLKINRVGNKKIESKIASENLQVDFITIGKKSEGIIRGLSKKIIASFPELTYLPSIESVRPVVKIIMEEYLNKNYDKVVVVYTDYISTINQQAKIRQILPISKIDIEKQIAEIDDTAGEYGLEEPKLEYKVEPGPDEVLDFIFPRLIEMQIYHAVLESNASKESVRMMAMRNATDAASDMVEDLTLTYNQLRQTKITQEIAEISAGSAALRG
ncbi:MAG: ATP synthase F1 subunit gamma [Candidatus Moranbacteria bacterium CG_4_8_14_3_um_filter_34_16]|nr:MAG: ATP synthase F1 subunit gamma [Candidatus Moranbacteria bacterium CG08_land_8_20_14_0_20_34_16]PIW94952.1 MAG: ATP synthase F1 subunit gamma [Candidatus Moranbacteria bacterium CG_4_8_14_3_um_filter_34_16]